MVKELQYTNIRRVLDDLKEHPLMGDLSLEQVVRHTVRFISLHGFSKFYQDKITEIDIKDFRGVLPCDLVSIIQVKDLRTGLCLRSMTDSFTPGMELHPKMYGAPCEPHFEEGAFKTQGRVIYTSFPEGKVEIAYKSIPVDEDGFPMVIDNENYLAALEAYIKKQVFTVKFETGKMALNVLQNAQAEYTDLSRQMASEFVTPSVSEMESYSRLLQTLIPRVREFDKGFKSLGSREYIRRH